MDTQRQSAARILVFGNEKGGSGKSTAALHTAVALLRMGYRVGSIDLDARQATLTRAMRNRFNFITRTREALPSPFHMAIERSEAASIAGRQAEEGAFLDMALAELYETCNFVVIDTPGADSHLSRLAHARADILITPLNDSYIDLDLLADIDPDTHAILGASVYTKMVEEQREEKRRRDGRAQEWIVMRNRLSHIDALNKREIGDILEKISHKQGFRIAPGFGERVIFRELFLKGLTVMDLKEDPNNTLTISQVAARQEVRNLIRAIEPERFVLPPDAAPLEAPREAPSCRRTKCR
ncbi:MAG: division plane positioning ATPase MipZ, partial [Alphaproteobacteria bacterium]|nr:division plane positioning ATPase MipZ [Alphaproteobacteria bacterium]